MYTKLYTSEYGNFIFQNVIYFFFDRRIIGQMRRNLEQAVSSLPNQWPPLTPCLSLQGSARSPTRPVPARPVTACLMMMLTTHCLPLQPNLGPIGKWYFCSSLLKMEGQGHIYFGLYSCQHLELWKFKTSYLVFQNLCQYRVKVISKCQVQTYFIENLLQYVFFFFLIYLLSIHYCFISPVNQKPNLQSPCSRMKRRRTCSPQNLPANLQQRWVRWTD